jgi:SHS2 domain-containing protein
VGSVEAFDHTADVGLRIQGDDLTDLFRTAAAGLFDYIVANPGSVRDRDAETVELSGDDTSELLVAWLNELIFRSETRHRLYTRFGVQISVDGRNLQAEIGGEPIDRQRHVLDHEVKAVTHHGLCLEREGEGWVAEVILDI